MLTGFRKCASWKIPTIPSKVRTLLQGAHEKVRTFAERRADIVRSVGCVRFLEGIAGDSTRGRSQFRVLCLSPNRPAGAGYRSPLVRPKRKLADALSKSTLGVTPHAPV
jgi:hypothetical protein